MCNRTVDSYQDDQSITQMQALKCVPRTNVPGDSAKTRTARRRHQQPSSLELADAILMSVPVTTDPEHVIKMLLAPLLRVIGKMARSSLVIDAERFSPATLSLKAQTLDGSRLKCRG